LKLCVNSRADQKHRNTAQAPGVKSQKGIKEHVPIHGRLTEPHNYPLRGSVLPADNCCDQQQWSILRFWRVHPEKGTATLNKCKPQKV
jgi:hypothetical protein